jgi:hypothetical protein
MHDAAHGDRAGDEQQEREKVLRRFDAPGVNGRREIPVE